MHKFLGITILIFAGELIFSLPFHISRFFRPTFLEAFSLTNTQLGDIFSLYGILAFISYFPGGLIADKFSTRKLISLSMILTSLGGLYLASYPGVNGLYAVFSFWGVTTILLFWAALIKATREWGGADSQGLGFGILDGGRGLVASAFASIAILIIGDSMIGGGIAEKQVALRNVIYFYTFSTAIFGVLCWYFIPDDEDTIESTRETFDISKILYVIKNKNIWLISIVVIASYCGYKALDNYGLYANQILGMSDIESAKFTTYISYSRVFIAIIAGFIADKFQVKKTISVTFLLVAISFFALSFFGVSTQVNAVVLLNIMITVLGVYALRAVYFAIIEDVHIELSATGTAVGAISVLGYTPDIFFASIAGRVLDSGNQVEGFQRYFILLAVISIIGLIASIFISKKESEVA